jgi:hypothetical protein
MGTYRTGWSNTRPTDKLKRVLKFGQSQLATYKDAAPTILVETRTFYLTRSDKSILSVKEWIAMGKPDYVVSGSKKGCEGTRERLMSAQI